MSGLKNGEDLETEFATLIQKVFIEGPISFFKKGSNEVKGGLGPLFAIQTYISNGLLYPPSDEAFSEKYPKATFEPVNYILPDLYGNTKKGILHVATSCDEFNKDGLGGLLSYPNLMIVYAETAINLLESKDYSLLKQIDIMTDEKYRNPANFDDAFDDAKEIALDNLKQLGDKAKKKEKDTRDLNKKLTEFYSKVDGSKTLINNADAQFSKPVTVEGKTYQTVIEYLDAELEELAKLEKKVFDDYIKEEKFPDNPATWEFWRKAAKYGYEGGGSGALLRFVNVMKRLREAEDNTSKVFNSRHHIITMRGMISVLVKQIEAAIDAIGAVGNSLNDQARNIELLMDSFQNITEGSDSTVLAIRRSNMRDGVKTAIVNFEKIRTNAKALGDSARLRVKPDEEQ